MTPIMPIAQKLRAVYERSRSAQAGFTDFDERDLLKLLENVGFLEIYLALQSAIVPGHLRTFLPLFPSQLGSILEIISQPLAPTLEEAMQQALTADEADQFTKSCVLWLKQDKG